jgi:hypothetical protein
MRLCWTRRCLTNASSGGREADFAWLLGVFGAAPLMRGVRRQPNTNFYASRFRAGLSRQNVGGECDEYGNCRIVRGSDRDDAARTSAQRRGAERVFCAAPRVKDPPMFVRTPEGSNNRLKRHVARSDPFKEYLLPRRFCAKI